MKERSDAPFEPADRRLNLFGMILGTGFGALPAALPEPISLLVNWVAVGILIGFLFPFGVLAHGHWHVPHSSKSLWFLGIGGAAVGGVAGAVAWGIGRPLDPVMGLCSTCTGGFFAGFIVVDSYLRRLDARRRQDENLWRRPEIQ